MLIATMAQQLTPYLTTKREACAMTLTLANYSSFAQISCRNLQKKNTIINMPASTLYVYS